MEKKPELSKEEVAEHLTEACDRQIEALRETLKAHENLFGPLDTEREENSVPLLRLRKVYCHVIAIAAWCLDEWVFHVMAPDIRAALEQLRPLALASNRELLDSKKQNELSRHFDELDNLLAPLTHPTIMNLGCLPEANGTVTNGGIKRMYNLCFSLHCLLTHYATTLDMEAIRSGVSTERLGNIIVEQADPLDDLKLANAYLSVQVEPSLRRDTPIAMN